MNDLVIITAYVVTHDLMNSLGHRSHVLAQVSDAEVITIAVVAARYFGNNHERALYVMKGMRYLTGSLSVSRFNRRLHQLKDWFSLLLETLGELFAVGEAFIIDSMPVPVCKRARARRNKKVRGRAYCGYCAAKKEKFFGWRLHLICTPAGLPVRFELLPGGLHDLTPIHELTYGLPEGANVYGDKGYNAKEDEQTIQVETGVRLVPIRKANMKPHEWVDEYHLRKYRESIETVNSQLEKMGVERLHARTQQGLEIKTQASLFALFCNNIN
jgi:hypothetical protein